MCSKWLYNFIAVYDIDDSFFHATIHVRPSAYEAYPAKRALSAMR